MNFLKGGGRLLGKGGVQGNCTSVNSVNFQECGSSCASLAMSCSHSSFACTAWPLLTNTKQVSSSVLIIYGQVIVACGEINASIPSVGEMEAAMGIVW